MISFEEFKKEVNIKREPKETNEYNSDSEINLRYKNKEFSFHSGNLEHQSLEWHLERFYNYYFEVKNLLIKSVNVIESGNEKEYYVETTVGNFKLNENKIKRILLEK